MNRPIRDGFFLVWRHQRLVWWIFFVNLFLGFLASIPARVLFQPVLGKSFYSNQLTQSFDVTVYLELLAKPEVSVAPVDAAAAVVAFVFLIYMLFISGGVLAVYRDDRKLSRSQFFESCGDFFWRMVRLLLCSIIPFGVVFALIAKVQSVTGKMASDAPWEMQGFWFRCAGLFLCLLMALFVRAWFDLAQTRTVCDRARGMFVLSFRSFVLALRNLPRLLFNYFAVMLVGALLIAATWFVWLRIPHQSFGASWLLLELLSAVLVALRLWQRASTMLWYENHAELNTVPIPLPPSPLPAEILEAEPVLVAPSEFA